MRSIQINFNSENQCPDGYCLGNKGEHNATELVIKPPEEMLNSDKIECLVIAFRVGAHKVFRSDVHEKAETIKYKLPREVTCANKVDIQLEGYDSAEELIVKSDMVENFYFNNSICGEETDGEVSKSLSGEIAANSVARHTHQNAEVLNALADNNGSLTYNGNPIGGSLQINSMFLEVGTGVDIYEGYGNDIIGLMYPAADDAMPCSNDAVILDVGIVLQNGSEIRASQFPQSANFGADAVHHIFPMSQIDNEFSAYVLFRVVKDNYQANELCGKLLAGEYSGVKIYYLGGN